MQSTSSALEQDLPTPAERHRRALSIVWTIPLIAGAIAVWLAYTTLAEKGPVITIAFKTAEGLEAGKTKVKYKDVEIGLVTDIALAVDFSHIIVTAEMAKDAAPYLNDGTDFWIVRPRIGAGGVSGLSTLVSGAFVEVDPGKGKTRTDFVGLEQPPPITSDVVGREFVLRANALGSVSRGSPILFQGLEVGEILGHELDEDGQGVTLFAFVREPYDQWVTEETRFWNISGINITTGADGVRLSTGSIQSVLIGGVTFDSPITTGAGQAAAGTEFPLYDDFESATESAFTETLPFLVYFDGSVRGLHVNAPVEFRGIKVGRVADIRLVYDTRDDSLAIPVVIEIEPERVGIVGDIAADASDDYATMNHLIGQGLRAQLVSGSLLTGELLVALDFHKDQPSATLGYDQALPDIPSIPSDFDSLTKNATNVAAQFAALPIGEIGADLQRILKQIDMLVSSPTARHSMEALSETLDDLRTLMAKVDDKTDPLLATILGTLERADLMLDQSRSTLASVDGAIGDGSTIRHGLDSTLDEISGAARSIRILADYLERHPEALLRGK